MTVIPKKYTDEPAYGAIDLDTSLKDLFLVAKSSTAGGTYGVGSSVQVEADKVKQLLNTPLTAKISLTAAQVKLLSSVPQIIVAAPQAGYAIDPISAAVFIDYGTVTFNAASGILEIYTDTGVSQHLRTESSIITATSDKFEKMYHQTGDLASIVPAKALKIRSINDSTLGDSLVYIYITYQIIKV